MTERFYNAIKSQVVGLDRSAGQAKFGVISSVDRDSGNVKVVVQPDGVLSGWLPMLYPWVGDGWGMICPPSAGDQVLIVAHEGDVEQGVVVGRAYSRKAMPPAVEEGECWLVHRKGNAVKLCNDGTVRVVGDLHVDGMVYDKHGSLAQLREKYNAHTHTDSRGGTTSPTNRND